MCAARNKGSGTNAFIMGFLENIMAKLAAPKVQDSYYYRFLIICIINHFHLGYLQTGTFVNSEDPDGISSAFANSAGPNEMSHKVTFH